jgi:hypothetical protein
MSHAHAVLTPKGRIKLALVIAEGGLVDPPAAERFQCAPATANSGLIVTGPATSRA